ncbi:MAG: MaoC/PaaZ C-terminal domain-containing protein [Gemmobacter sp.]
MGTYIDDFKVGQVDTSPGRTITETDVVTYSWISGDTNPMHTDAEHARTTPIGERLAHGTLCLSVVTGLSARIGYLDGTAIAALGIDEWKFVRPVLIGDTVTLRSTVEVARISNTKPDRGVLVRRMELFNQRGELVQTGLMSTLVKSRAADAPVT